MRRPAPQAQVSLVQVDELLARIEERFADAIAGFVPAERPALVDRHGLARELSLSVASLDKLRRDAGFPEVRVLDSPRFEVAEVVAWLRERRARVE